MSGSVISDADLRTYVSTLEQTVIQLNDRLLALEAALSNEVSSLSTKQEALQTQVGTQGNLITLETSNRANTVQHVDDRVSSLEVTHSKDHAYIVGLIEDHHGEQMGEAASIRASLSEERSERVIGDEAVLAKLTEHEDQAQWYYDDTKAHLSKHDQALDDRTWDQDTWSLDDDEYTFGWSILASAQEWELYIGQYVNQLQTMVSDQMRDIEATVIQAQQEASQALENTDIERLLDTLQGQIGSETLDAMLWGKIEDMEDAIAREQLERINQIAEEAKLYAAKLAAEAQALAEQLSQESTERIDAIAAEAARRTELLEMEAQERIAAINALAASSTDALIAKALELSTEYDAKIASLRTQVTQELKSLQDGVTVSVEELKSVDASIITSLNAYKVSNGQNIAAIQDRVDVVTNAQESTADQVTALTASFSQLDSSVAQAQADIITSNQVRADADAALTVQIDSLNTGLGNANSRIDSVNDAVSTLDSATATKFSALDAELVDVNTSVASARQIADSAVTTNTAQASEINTLKSRMTTTENNVTKKADANALSTLETKVDNADAALANRIDELVANLTTPDGTEIDANAFNALRAEVSSNSDSITTHTSQITSLQSSLSNVNTGLSANADAVADLTTTVTQHEDSITSQAQSIQQLQSDLDLAETNLATKASTSALNTTNSKVNSIDGRVTANTNSLNSLGSRMSTVEGAVETKADVSAVNALTTRVGNVEGGLSTQANSITSLEAGLRSAASSAFDLIPNPTFDPLYNQMGFNVVPSTAAGVPAGCPFPYVTKLDRRDHFIIGADNLQCKTGDVFEISALVACGAGTADFNLYTYRRSNITSTANIQTANGGNTKASVNAGTWQRVTWRWTVPEHAFPFFTPFLQVNQWSPYGTVWYATDWHCINVTAAAQVKDTADATASALSALDTKVTAIDGEVTSQASSISKLQSDLSATDTKAGTALNNAATAQTTANTAVTNANANATSITNLASRMSTAEGNINKKADATALNSYYTKTAADTKATEIAAGEVSKYDASLVIGGVNLINRHDELKETMVNQGGELSSYAGNSAINGYITVKAGEPITLSKVSEAVDNYFRYAFYDDYDKVVLRQASSSNLVKLTTPENATRFRVSYPTVSLVQAERGTKATAFAPSSADVQNQLDANATAIENTNAEVRKVDGRVTTESNRITTLAGRVTTAEKGLALKADATALNNIYTKTESDAKATSLAAGEVSKYDASLVIGGTNLLRNSNFADELTGWELGGPNTSVTIVDDTKATFKKVAKVVSTTASAGLKVINAVALNELNLAYGEEYTFSGWLRADTTMTVHVAFDGGGNANASAISVGVEWVKFTHTKKAWDNRIPRLYGSGTFYVANLKIERGNKATDWSEADSAIIDSLNANASAIQVTNSEVSRIGDAVTSQASDLVSLSSSIGKNNLINKDAWRLAGNLGYISPNGSISRLSSHVHSDFIPVSTNQLSWALTDIGSGGNTSMRIALYKEDRTFHSIPVNGGVQTVSSGVINIPDTAAYVRISVPLVHTVEAVFKSSSVDLSGYATASAVQSLTTRVSTAEGKIITEATKLTNLSSTVGGHTTTINSQTTSINGIRGVHALKFDTNGVISGFGLISELVGGKVTSAFGVNADQFYVGSPKTGKKVFAVVNGTTVINDAVIGNLSAAKITTGTMHGDRITAGTIKVDRLDSTELNTKGLSALSANLGTIKVDTANIEDGAITTAKIGDLQVDTLKIKQNAVTVPVVGTWTGTQWSTETMITLGTLNVEVDSSCLLLANAALKLNWPDGTRWWRVQLTINSTVVFDTYGDNFCDSVAVVGALSVAPGTHTVSLRWFGNKGMQAMNRTIWAMAAKK